MHEAFHILPNGLRSFRLKYFQWVRLYSVDGSQHCRIIKFANAGLRKVLVCLINATGFVCGLGQKLANSFQSVMQLPSRCIHQRRSDRATMSMNGVSFSKMHVNTMRQREKEIYPLCSAQIHIKYSSQELPHLSLYASCSLRAKIGRFRWVPLFDCMIMIVRWISAFVQSFPGF